MPLIVYIPGEAQEYFIAELQIVSNVHALKWTTSKSNAGQDILKVSITAIQFPKYKTEIRPVPLDAALEIGILWERMRTGHPEWFKEWEMLRWIR